MALSIRRPILDKYLRIVCGLSLCVGVLLSPASAQRPIGRVGPTGAPAAPPVIHTPMDHAPLYRAPIYQPTLSRPSYVPLRPSMRRPLPTLGSLTVRPPFRPIRPPIVIFNIFPPLAGPFWFFGSCWWTACDQFWFSGLTYDAFSDGWSPANVAPPLAIPVYVYGDESQDVPQLFLKDGTILNVNDYWLIDDQLHFLMLEEQETKPTEHVIPFDALDLQKTVDVNTRRGFHFMLRNEPVDQYMRDHPDEPHPQPSPQHS
jgi:hypothetical protein